MALRDLLQDQITELETILNGFGGNFGNGVPELYVNAITAYTILKAGLEGQEDIVTALTNEITSRVQTDTELSEGLNLTNQRIDNLLYDPIPDSNIKNGSRLYLDEFIEVFSTDQVDGLEQRFALFTNALSGKLSDLIASVGTGITIDKSNPAFPVISQNRPLWDNIQNKPVGIQLTNQKGQPNGYPSLDSGGKIPVSQISNLNSSLQIVSNITERNALVLTGNTPVLVIDASDDSNVTSGHAFYVYDFANTTWIKTSEQESLDIILSWMNITGKPTTFPPEAHNHLISEITGLQTALDGKRNTEDTISANYIIQENNKFFVSTAEQGRWNNDLYDFGTVTSSPSFFDFGLYNSFKVTLGGNITVNINSPRSGQVYIIKFIQDATGGRTVTLPGSSLLPSGESIDTDPNSISLLTLHYDGTEYLASWKSGF